MVSNGLAFSNPNKQSRGKSLNAYSKKRKRRETPFLLEQFLSFSEKSIKAMVSDVMEAIEQEWIKQGGTISH